MDYLSSSRSSASSLASSSKSMTDSMRGSVSRSFSATSSSVGNYLNGNTLVERIIFLLLVVIVFVILLSVITQILSAVLKPHNPFIVDGLLTATNGKVIPSDPSASGGVEISRSDNEETGIEFSWSVWVNITNLDDQYAVYKHIFSKGDNTNVVADNGKSSPNNSPGLYIVPSSNTLVVFMNTFESIEEKVEITNVPLNKWLHILIRIEGTYLDVYINGILAKRHVLPSVPKQNNGNIYVAQNGGFNGYISNLRYYEYALQPGDIMEVVNAGPSLKVSKLESSDLKSIPDYLSLDWYFQNAV